MDILAHVLPFPWKLSYQAGLLRRGRLHVSFKQTVWRVLISVPQPKPISVCYLCRSTPSHIRTLTPGPAAAEAGKSWCYKTDSPRWPPGSFGSSGKSSYSLLRMARLATDHFGYRMIVWRSIGMRGSVRHTSCPPLARLPIHIAMLDRSAKSAMS